MPTVPFSGIATEEGVEVDSCLGRSGAHEEKAHDFLSVEHYHEQTHYHLPLLGLALDPAVNA